MVRGDRSVDVFVRKLRTKLERISPDWRYVHTHFGVGYRFGAERNDGAGAEHDAQAAARRRRPRARPPRARLGRTARMYDLESSPCTDDGSL